MIVAQPFDPSLLGAIEKAIRTANLGLNPTNDGKVVRIPIPALTEERRKELSKLVHKYAEEGRNGVRQVRRDANDKLKKLLKDQQDLRRRRAARPRRGAEDHRPARRDDRRPAEEERTRSCSGSDNVAYVPNLQLSTVAIPNRQSAIRRQSAIVDRQSQCPTSPTSNAASVRRRAVRSRASNSTCAPAALPCWRATTSTRRGPGGRRRWPAARRTCGATAS